jgi:hypothetical protein
MANCNHVGPRSANTSSRAVNGAAWFGQADSGSGCGVADQGQDPNGTRSDWHKARLFELGSHAVQRSSLGWRCCC